MSEKKTSPKNSKKFPMVPVVVVATLLGAAAFSFLRKKPMMDGQKAMPGQRALVNEEKAGRNLGEEIESAFDFEEIWQNRQGSYKCEMSSEEMSYAYYFDNERLAMDTQIEGKSAHMIWDGDYIYNWSDDTKQGTKMMANFDELKDDVIGFDADEYEAEMAKYEEMAEEMVEVEEEEVEEIEIPAVKCQKWQVDNKKFELPSDVVFQDLSQMQLYMGE